MKNTLCSKIYDSMEVEYEYIACPGDYDTPGYVRLEILCIRTKDSSVNLYDWVSLRVLERLEDEIQEQENNAYNLGGWENKQAA
jgi:hypothetical protein